MLKFIPIFPNVFSRFLQNFPYLFQNFHKIYIITEQIEMFLNVYPKFDQ